MTVHDSRAAAPGPRDDTVGRSMLRRIAQSLVTALVTGICVTGCSLVVDYSCSADGESQTDSLRDDIAGLRTVTAAEAVSDCDSGGNNVVSFDITSVDEARDEFAGLTDCHPGDLPRGESSEDGFGYQCDFPSGPTSVFLVHNSERDESQALAEEP